MGDILGIFDILCYYNILAHWGDSCVTYSSSLFSIARMQPFMFLKWEPIKLSTKTFIIEMQTASEGGGVKRKMSSSVNVHP